MTINAGDPDAVTGSDGSGSSSTIASLDFYFVHCKSTHNCFNLIKKLILQDVEEFSKESLVMLLLRIIPIHTLQIKIVGGLLISRNIIMLS